MKNNRDMHQWAVFIMTWLNLASFLIGFHVGMAFKKGKATPASVAPVTSGQPNR